MTVHHLARAMYDRRCRLDHADPEEAALMWLADPGVRDFWVAEAQYAWDWLFTHVLG